MLFVQPPADPPEGGGQDAGEWLIPLSGKMRARAMGNVVCGRKEQACAGKSETFASIKSSKCPAEHFKQHRFTINEQRATNHEPHQKSKARHPVVSRNNGL